MGANRAQAIHLYGDVVVDDDRKTTQKQKKREKKKFENDRMKKCSFDVIWLFLFGHGSYFFLFLHKLSLVLLAKPRCEDVPACVSRCMEVWAVEFIDRVTKTA